MAFLIKKELGIMIQLFMLNQIKKITFMRLNKNFSNKPNDHRISRLIF
ncbi:unnamed protein product [Paramecium primaurelia]|uniref:Uncharacterized protein n=1 Tax=Paramecium primaurelia TaxID=5886 RepID=A0A8S1JN14_PARPR|nr:unnamed protein product [Paramecium primaurelia]